MDDTAKTEGIDPEMEVLHWKLYTGRRRNEYEKGECGFIPSEISMQQSSIAHAGVGIVENKNEGF